MPNSRLFLTFAALMAGIYVHIPFCKSRCVYCGFFSTTSLEKRALYVAKLVEELAERRDFLQGADIETIYFGGGTPSQLSVAELERLLSGIYSIYNVRANAEVTFEANPDDLNQPYLTSLRSLGINRLSIGVQTFDESRLRFLHRRHTAAQAIRAVRDAQEAGFSNVSIDLMFGFPCQMLDEWKRDVQMALSLQVQHLSAYALMYEEGTPLERMLASGEIEEVEEGVSLQMYEHLMDALESAGYRHYEISNFAQSGKESRHNSGYWRGVPYLGIGAGAHSYDGCRRYSHSDSLLDYLSGAPLAEERLTEAECYDEFVFTGLRTAEGIRLDELQHRFGEGCLQYFMENARPHFEGGRLVCEGGSVRLSRQGLFVSNDVMSDLMWVE